MNTDDDLDPSYRELPDSQASPEDQVDRHDMLKRINRIIVEALTEKQRNALTVVALHGFRLEEAARRSHQSLDAAGQTSHRYVPGLYGRVPGP
jgi:DNA-directed RNA polymerase specialized sigma24 family protein